MSKNFSDTNLNLSTVLGLHPQVAVPLVQLNYAKYL
jgi:hypothetical protein